MNNMSPRERMLALIVASVVGLALLYQFVLDPYLVSRAETQEAILEREDDLWKADKVFREQRDLKVDLAKLTEKGLKSDVSEARSQLLYAVNDWVKQSGLTFSSIKEGRTEVNGKWIEVNVQLTGTGPQAAVAQLLWRLETAAIPIRVNEMTINAPKEGINHLQINLGISTLCEDPSAPEPAVRRTVASASGRE